MPGSTGVGDQPAEGPQVGRVGHPEDIARTFVFLAAPRSDFIPGQCVVVDGGSSRPLYSLK